MPSTEIEMDGPGGVTYKDGGESLGVSLDHYDYVQIGLFLLDSDFAGVALDRQAVGHLRDALSDWLGG